MRDLITWIDLNTVTGYLIQVTGGPGRMVFHVECDGQYLSLPDGVGPVVVSAALPGPADMPLGLPYFFKGQEPDGDLVDMVALKVPVENTPLFIREIRRTPRWSYMG
jgi:hypothetical protein